VSYLITLDDKPAWLEDLGVLTGESVVLASLNHHEVSWVQEHLGRTTLCLAFWLRMALERILLGPTSASLDWRGHGDSWAGVTQRGRLVLLQQRILLLLLPDGYCLGAARESGRSSRRVSRSRGPDRPRTRKVRRDGGTGRR
jgi:hypothetical protein